MTTKAIASKDNGLFLQAVRTDLKGQVIDVVMTSDLTMATKFDATTDEAESIIGDENGGLLSVPFDTDNGSNHFEVCFIDWIADNSFVGTRPVRRPNNG